MENKKLKSIMQDALKKEIPPAQIELWPAVKNRLVARKHPLFRQGETMNTTLFIRRAALAVLALTVAFSLLAFTPQGRTFAQQVLGYFATTTQKWYPAEPTPVVTPVPTYALPVGLFLAEPVPAVDRNLCGETVSPVSSSFPCQLLNAEADLGFSIKSFPADRVELEFQLLSVSPKSKAVYLAFKKGRAFYSIGQGLGEFPSSDSKWATVPVDAIQQVLVGDYPAEYAAGGLISTDNRNYTWDANQAHYRLRWREGNQWFSIVELRVGETAMDGAREGLITLAANLVGVSQGADKLAGSKTPTVEQAAGFDIREPTVLPDGFLICAASYYEIESLPKTSKVEYCNATDPVAATGFIGFYQRPQSVKDDLRWAFISQIQDNGLLVDEEVWVNDNMGRYLVSQDGFSAALLWEEESFKYMITVRWKSDFGGRLNRQSLIAIAESLK
jgi:hypothetical protein